MLQVHQFPCLSDNYGYLLHDPRSFETVCIDTPDADAYLREAAAKVGIEILGAPGALPV